MNKIKIKSISFTSNPTKLKKIHKNKFKIDLKKSVDDRLFFEIIKLDLDSYNLPPDGSIFIYVTAGQYEMKFNLGTVANIRIPKHRYLDELPAGKALWFRLLVVNDENCMIVASSEGNRAKGLYEKNRESLLAVDVRDDLKERMWKVHLLPEQEPILYLNSNFPKFLTQLQNSKVFQAVILQEAVRISLRHFIDSDRGDNNPDTWKHKWDLFLKDLNMYKTTPTDDADSLIIDKWIDNVVEKFSKDSKLFEKAVEEQEYILEKYGSF